MLIVIENRKLLVGWVLGESKKNDSKNRHVNVIGNEDNERQSVGSMDGWLITTSSRLPYVASAEGQYPVRRSRN